MTIVSSLIQGMTTSHDIAMQLRAASDLRSADTIDETLVRAFFALSAALDRGSAAMRSFNSLLDLNQPLHIDGLATPNYALPCVRVRAAMSVPDLDDVSSLDQIRTTIHDAISIGAPTYNTGDQRGCGIIYWATALSLVSLPAIRGFAGQAKALKPLRQMVDETMPLLGNDPRVVDDFAWRMRHALDATLAVTG